MQLPMSAYGNLSFSDHLSRHENWDRIAALRWVDPSRYTIHDMIEIAKVEIAGAIRRGGVFRPIRDFDITVTDESVDSYRPPEQSINIKFQGLVSLWNSSSANNIVAELGAIERAFFKKNRKLRLSFFGKGMPPFPIKSRFTVPLNKPLVYKNIHWLKIPPRLSEREHKMLRAAGIKPVVGVHNNAWVLHLNDEEKYLYAKLLF